MAAEDSADMYWRHAQMVAELHLELSVVRNEVGALDVGVWRDTQVVRELDRRVVVGLSFPNDDTGPDLRVDVYDPEPGGDATYAVNPAGKFLVAASQGKYDFEQTGGARLDAAQVLTTVRNGISLFLAYARLPLEAKDDVPRTKVEDRVRSRQYLAEALGAVGITNINLFHGDTMATPAETLFFFVSVLPRVTVPD